MRKKDEKIKRREKPGEGTEKEELIEKRKKKRSILKV